MLMPGKSLLFDWKHLSCEGNGGPSYRSSGHAFTDLLCHRPSWREINQGHNKTKHEQTIGLPLELD